ncbi:MAG TPA: GuaB1 family IMP dehydrogenase-related protein [Polyangiaceae bacterium LLY-WYZ-15_(1-7)]|nr:GuaB1 family IMP dehydrogenase-related protein [Myxococcales bacterium]MAT24068.1 GuaB1 family IMP dehydrogenase-related protein [Sandaracinus sp.]HJK90063.1 GuaB1 family IMP dehydrogenase-related protein [Polyangiaceae bacterium LLY-WYZ-15_(1-7)]MBJ70926.1 GuaB1 family IMP dehydrogenase-related protein [Sandaracinus sp.]HJL03922.1 GuaB1 family IMP dehydrogenase-related protein [Polyangiaceae bacterium LLY-WYZ-15_(1-7)]
MRFLHPERDEQLELALEDVFIVPDYFDGVSRLEVSLAPGDFPGSSQPIVSANMNAVTGKRMAETMARYGGLGVLPQDMRLETVERIVGHIHGAHDRFDTALTVTPEATLRDVRGIIRKRSHDMVVVVDAARRPLGVVTGADLERRDQYTAVGRIMSEEMVTLPSDVTNEDAYGTMHKARVKAAPVVDARGVLVGILGREDAVRTELLAPSRGAEGHLMVAAAVGISRDSSDRAAALVEMGVDCVVVDTAHGHQRRMLEALAEVKKRVGGRVPVVAGNVCTSAGTEALIEAGADIVKVNVGPGAMCTTRMQTAVGRPSFTSVLHCARAAHQRGKKVWADGGVRHPRDVALYLAAGASRVMIGTALAGTYESPGDIEQDPEGALYKENYGMASARAVSDRTEGESPFARAKKGFFREGISSSRIYLRPGFESVGDIVIDMITGVQSAFTYVGATDLRTFRERVCVGVQTLSGYGEGTPHGRVRR